MNAGSDEIAGIKLSILKEDFYFVSNIYFMKLFLTTIILIILSNAIYSQNDKDIILQFIGESITIRKQGENNPMMYSEKHDKILTIKEEFAAYSDSKYHVIKPRIIIFSAKVFETDAKPQINIRVDYYYWKSKNQIKEIEQWGKSYYPSNQKIVKMKDTRDTDGKVLFTMDDKSEWLVEINKDGSTSLFYLTHSDYSYLNFALMFPNCKKEIENGNRL